eukprot:gene30734-33094_t
MSGDAPQSAAAAPPGVGGKRDGNVSPPVGISPRASATRAPADPAAQGTDHPAPRRLRAVVRVVGGATGRRSQAAPFHRRVRVHAC